MTKKEIKAFILSAVKQRNAIIDKGVCLKDTSKIKTSKAILMAYVNKIPTTQRMAKFYITHFAKIKYLLPPNRYNKAESIYYECQLLIN